MGKMLKVIMVLLVVVTVVFAAGCADSGEEATEEPAEGAEEEGAEEEGAEEEASEGAEAVESEETVTESTESIPGDYAAKYLDKYRQEAQLLFSPSEKMKVGETEIVKVYITRNTSESVSYSLDENETLQSRDIKVTPKMKVTLLEKEAGTFEIETFPSNSDGVLTIIGDEFTTWRWKVTPKKSGKQTLLLCVDYIVAYQNPDGTIIEVVHPDSRELEEEIEVEVNPIYTITSNGKWIIGTVIAILGLPIVNNLISKLRKQK